jgi:hypothetical protein
MSLDDFAGYIDGGMISFAGDETYGGVEFG